MKKRFFATIALFSSLVLVACGGTKKCEKHQWGSYEETKAATCTVAGEKTRTCKVCGEKDKAEIPAGHKYEDNWSVKEAATCAAEGTEARVCTVCGEGEETRAIAKLDHNWEEKETVAKTGEDDANYTKIECSMCHKQGIRVAAAQAEFTFTNSSKQALKTAPEGCVKLPSNTDSMLLKINIAEAKTGTIYQRGSMDYWYTSSNENQLKTYYDQNSGNTDVSAKKGNFKVEVGTDPSALTEVELPDNTALTYGDMLPAAVGFSNIDGTDWSTIGDCIVGSVSLSAGMNYIRYTRVDSFNLAVHDFDIIFD